MLLFSPIVFQALSGIALANDPSVLSETRAPGGALLVSGFIMIMGAFIGSWTSPGLQLSSLLYLSYGLSRLVSMALDGMPHEALIQATVAELIIGALSLTALAWNHQLSRRGNV